jgi:translation initiation factor 1
VSRPTRGDGWEFIPSARRAAQEAAQRGVKRFQSDPPDAQKIVIREEKRNKGKIVTVARGFRLNAADLKKLAKTLKAHCASGGKVGDDEIEVQGRHRDKILASLLAAGYQAQAK